MRAKKKRGGIEKRDETVESGHSLGTRSPFLTFIIILFFLASFVRVKQRYTTRL